MQAELEQLLVLQNRQQKIRQIQTEIRTMPQQRQNLEAQLAASAVALTAETNLVRQRQTNLSRKVAFDFSSPAAASECSPPAQTARRETRFPTPACRS